MGVVHLTKATLFIAFNTPELLGARASRTCAPLMPTVPGRAAPQTPVIPYKETRNRPPIFKKRGGQGGSLLRVLCGGGSGWGGEPAGRYIYATALRLISIIIKKIENRDALGLMHPHNRAGIAVAPRQFPVAFLCWRGWLVGGFDRR